MQTAAAALSMALHAHRITGTILLLVTTAAVHATRNEDAQHAGESAQTFAGYGGNTVVQAASSEDRLVGEVCRCTCGDSRTACVVERTVAVRGDMGKQGQPGPLEPPGLASEKPRVRSHRRANQQVAFSVARSNKLGPVTRNTPITFDRTFTNAGRRFQGSLTEFVAKLNGTYVFFAHVMATADANADAWIMHNDKHQLPLFGDMRAGYAAGSNTVILELTAGDRVWVQLSSGSATLNDYTSFSGYLLYEH